MLRVEKFKMNTGVEDSTSRNTRTRYSKYLYELVYERRIVYSYMRCTRRCRTSHMDTVFLPQCVGSRECPFV